MRTLTRIGILCSGLLTLTGCATASAWPRTTAPAESPTPPPGRVESWSGDDAGEPTLALYDDGTLGGFDGCNAFAGTYDRADNQLDLHLGYGTLKACIGVDMWLREASAAEIVDNTLHVYDVAGNERGILTADN